MKHAADLPRISLSVAAAFLFASCATLPRLYSEDELSAVEQACGVARGELIQEAEEPRLVFLFRQSPSPQQVSCVKQWTRKRRLTLALIDVKWDDK